MSQKQNLFQNQSFAITRNFLGKKNKISNNVNNHTWYSKKKPCGLPYNKKIITLYCAPILYVCL